MELSAEQITIAVTLYSRREFVLGAIRSALEQTIPVKVIVVEDCGPDPTLQTLIKKEFGTKIDYFRNEKRRGLFDNWNACMQCCSTQWLSILHDDDFLRQNFVESMLSLAQKAPGKALYFGRAEILEQGGTIITPSHTSKWGKPWREIDPIELAEGCFLLFPGQLFNIDRAESVGGFRPNSYLTADWDMWFRLVLGFGGAQSATVAAVVRSHDGLDRGTSRVNRMGWKHVLDNVQRKRNLRLLCQKKGISVVFDRTKLLTSQPVPSRLMLCYAKGFSRRMLYYNATLLVRSAPRSTGYAVLQAMVKLFGPRVLRLFSLFWNRFNARKTKCLAVSAAQRHETAKHTR